MSWSQIQPRRALQNALTVYTISVPDGTRDMEQFYSSMRSELLRRIAQTLLEQTGVKVQICAWIRLFKPTSPNETTVSFFWTKQTALLRGDSPSLIDDAMPKLYNSVDRFLQKGSGWVVDAVQSVEVHFARYQPLRGGCPTNPDLPKYLTEKRAVTSIVSNDHKCLVWCYLAHKHPVAPGNNPNRVSHYTNYRHEAKTAGLNFPLKLEQVAKFETLNSISVNVYGYEDEVIIPLYISRRKETDHMDVLLYQGHFSLIRNLDRLLSDQRGGHRKKFFCPRCLHAFYNNEQRNQHITRCINEQNTRVEIPEHGIMKFNNIRRQQRRACVVVADMEVLLMDVPGVAVGATRRDKVHVPSGYSVITNRTCCDERKFENRETYRGKDCVQRFVKYLLGTAMIYHHDLDTLKDMHGLDDSDDPICHICNEVIIDPAQRVRDHCHLCGQYRGQAHNRCNLQLQLDQDIVVLFHNGRHYDFHLLIKEMGALCAANNLKLTCIAKSIEDYLTFSIVKNEMDGTTWKIRFVDSFQFMGASLETLAEDLEPEHFHAMRQAFPDYWELLIEKQSFMYEEMTGWHVFDRTDMPVEKHFDSKLKGPITKERYEHFKKVWTKLGIKSWGMFHDVYVATDTLMLHDIIERFRFLCIKIYGLDPLHYFTLPQFSWDACLKKTKVELELLSDIEMYTMLEAGARGGISVISHRKAEANNPYIDTYDPAQPSSYLMYLDINNLYGAAMCDPLPVDNFRWLTGDEISMVDFGTHPHDHATGYILEVDLDYPASLHPSHNEYPMAPDHIEVHEGMLSPYCQQIKQMLNLKPPLSKKLAPNLMPKERYVVHYRNLHFYLTHGMKVTKVHRVLAFHQESWIKPYVELNTELRTNAKSDFEKALYKLMVNAIFGKSMQNVRNYRHVHLIMTKAEFLKLVASPRYKGATIFSDDLVGVMMAPKVTKLDKPIYDGFTILETSKLRMYSFHYEYIKPKYGERAQLLFTDTDSFLYHIRTDDVYLDMLDDLTIYDTSGYPPGHFLYSPVNKNKLGKMKDETNSVPIEKFIGLKAKMYAFKFGDKEVKKAKGISKHAVKTSMSFESFEKCLSDEVAFRHRMYRFESRAHTIYSVDQEKLSLTPYDDKRYIMLDGITTRAHGYMKSEDEPTPMLG